MATSNGAGRLGTPSASVDRPVAAEATPTMDWGSDAFAEAIRRLDVPFIALNPGASYRGLHDSIVNYLGNEGPSMLVCLHEEHAVAIAHGYAKVTGEPLAVAIHSNVGLMHASMALYNAFCDRVPLIVIGAQGPLDAAKRRPWIDWIHTTADPGALIRNYTKWDDQPVSVQAALHSLARAGRIARTYPCGPTFVSLDAALQEQRLGAEGLRFPDVERTRPPAPPSPSAEQASQVAEVLRESPRTVVLIGRTGTSDEAWDARVALVEALGAQVITETKIGAVFPTDDSHHAAAPSALPSDATIAILRDATAVLSLDWVDLEGTLRIAFGGPAPVPVVHCSLDHTLHNGWSKDHFDLPEVDVFIAAHPDALVGQLLELGVSSPSEDDWRPELATAPSEPVDGDTITVRGLARALRRATQDMSVSLLRVPLGWDGRDLELAHPLDHIGYDGGAGIGSGPGMAVGAALALIGTDRLPVAVLGDGDFLMGCSALWTAARHRVPVLIIVANNRSFYNDEMHQERVARQRSRPVENRWIGQHLRDPEPDLASIARGLGLVGHGPIISPDDLDGALAEGVRQVREGGVVLIDVRVEASDYTVQPIAGGTAAVAGRGPGDTQDQSAAGRRPDGGSDG